ncbi:MAG: DUF4126 domain-containing protein [Sandaracinaceae bacterium]|nr:DUF4126 domain-containing protein [Sandaracinaceae bacterium]
MQELASQVSWDDARLALSWIPTIALAISLAASAGLRAFLPLLIAGVLSRVGVLELGQSYQFVGSTPALVCFGIATVLEIAGDKIPAVDHALDVGGTVVRPIAGSLLAASVMWQVNEPLWALVLGVIVGAPTALAPHAAKAATRGISTSFTAGLANPVLSIVEDVSAAAIAILAIVVPTLTALLLVVVVFLGWRWWRRRAARKQAQASAKDASGEASPTT